MSEFTALQGIIGVRDTYAPFTLAHLEELRFAVTTEEPLYIAISPRVRRAMRRKLLVARKGWPAPRRYRKGVHRAYRKLKGNA